MNAINRDAVRTSNLDSSSIGARDAVSAVLSIWWRDMPSQEVVASQVGGADDLSLIAEYEGRLVGFVLARVAYVGLPMAGVCLIHSMAVLPEYREHGIGTLLVEKLRDSCKAKGIQTVRALVPAANTRLMNYCEELGFQPSSTLNFDIVP